MKPKLAEGTVTGGSMVRQGYVAVRGKYLIYPAVQPDAAGNAAMVFTETSRSTDGKQNWGTRVVEVPLG